MAILSTDQLQKPEQIRAIERLQKALPKLESMYLEQLDTDIMFPSNYTAFFGNLVNLPHGDTWLWNQSNAKVHVTFGNYLVKMQKMNTRRRKNGPKAPFYKLWLFTITSKCDDFSTQFIWCEKGAEIQTPTSPKAEKLCSPTLSHPSQCQSPPHFDAFETGLSMPDIQPVQPIFGAPLNVPFQPNNFSFYPSPCEDMGFYSCPQESSIVDVDALLWPTYVYSDDHSFVNTMAESYNAEEVLW